MYKIKIHNFEKKYLLDEMIRVFLSSDDYIILSDDEDDSAEEVIHFNVYGSDDKNEIKREIYQKLASLTSHKPDWGILTGIRPVKLWGETFEKLGGDCYHTKELMSNNFLISDEKLDLIKDIYSYQKRMIGGINPWNASVYIGIPFCPTRCSYCSFASNQVTDSEIDRYFVALLKEIKEVGSMMKEYNMHPRCIYIGGGTPTTLKSSQLSELFCTIKEYMPMSNVKEITLEAGRPDTITMEKLKAAVDGGVSRISINPQTMNDNTLKLIGRNHDTNMIRQAFDIAKALQFEAINCDIIAGLPWESLDAFKNTVYEVLSLSPNNITIHSLAVKRGSKLIDIDKDYYHKIGRIVGEMLAFGRETLEREGFRPYYLYRQKHMAGANENTGYCKDDAFCIYNMAIMDEHEDIIALGAGGISKSFFPEENRLERIPNVTNYQEYINRVDEMIERKKIGFANRRVKNAY